MKVVLYAAQSLDGRITRGDEPGDAFASSADAAHFRAEIRTCDACVMGSATYDQSKNRLRPQAFPELRRVIWTRTPNTPQRRAETIPGVLEFTADPPAQIAARLRADRRTRCALLGGGEVNAAWLAAGLVDELCITVESWLFSAGTPLVGQHQSRQTSPGFPPVKLELLETKVLAPGGPVVLRYKIKLR